MPGALARFDDRWGVAWRISNLVRRFSLRRSARLLAHLIRPARFEQPVFVVGAPRSGTTLLFRVLAASGELGALPREGHDMWRAFHHPRYGGWTSDAIGSGCVRPGERRYIAAYLGSHIGRGYRRFVEKTPENSLRVPYLLDLYPDAHFVVVHRNPADVVNSLIQGWRLPEGRFRSYFVPRDLEIAGYPHRRRWCFALVDGWRELSTTSVAECAFAQWRACTEALAEHRSLVPSQRWHEVHLEELLARPQEEFARLAEGLSIEVSTAVAERLAESVAHPVNALSPPARHKWRLDNEAEVGRLLARIAPLAPLAGYDLNATSGEFEIVPPSRLR